MKLQGKEPKIAQNCFIAPSADLIGDVVIGQESSVWFQCVLRGDVSPIVVGEYTNIQDGTIIHGTHKKFDVQIGNYVTIGHKAMLHGCHIGDEAFVGMGATLLDGSVMAPKSFLAAGSILTEGKKTESGWLYMGAPAKKIRPLKEDEMNFLRQSANNYLMYKSWYTDEKELP